MEGGGESAGSGTLCVRGGGGFLTLCTYAVPISEKSKWNNRLSKACASTNTVCMARRGKNRHNSWGVSPGPPRGSRKWGILAEMAPGANNEVFERLKKCVMKTGSGDSGKNMRTTAKCVTGVAQNSVSTSEIVLEIVCAGVGQNSITTARIF